MNCEKDWFVEISNDFALCALSEVEVGEGPGRAPKGGRPEINTDIDFQLYKAST